MPESKSSSGGSGVATILLVIFVTLKLLNIAPVAMSDDSGDIAKRLMHIVDEAPSARSLAAKTGGKS